MKVATVEMESMLRDYYKQPEWALAFEVGNSTGFNCSRHIDAIAMNMYPSRGLELHGIEIKVSKSDLKRELSNPDKAEKIAAHVDRWWIAAPAEICTAVELPITWGLLSAKDGKLRVSKQATPLHNEKPDLTRGFLAAMLRAAHKASDAAINAEVKKRMQPEREKLKRELEYTLKCHRADGVDLVEVVKKIEAATGIKIERWTEPDRFARAVAFAHKSRIAELDSPIDNLAARARAFLEAYESIRSAA